MLIASGSRSRGVAEVCLACQRRWMSERTSISQLIAQHRESREGDSGTTKPRPSVRPPLKLELTSVRRPRAEDEPQASLPDLLRTLGETSQSGQAPSAGLYRSIIKAAGAYAGRRGLVLQTAATGEAAGAGADLAWRVALAAVTDAKAGNVPLAEDALEDVVKYGGTSHPALPVVLRHLLTGSPTPAVYSLLARIAIQNHSTDLLVLIIREMSSRGVRPPTILLHRAVTMLCEIGSPRAALEMLEALSETGEATLPFVWAHILTASVDALYVEGVERAWQKIIPSHAFTPDEGLLLRVMSVAARWGRPSLAIDALEVLSSKLRVTAGEHHLVPLLEAYVNAGQVPEAFSVLPQLRSAGINPNRRAVESITAKLRTVALVDQAFYALEDMRKSDKTIDPSALNAVIDASMRLDDMQRVRATQLAAASLGVAPNVEMFNLVLEACARTKMRRLGDTVMADMATAGIKMDATSYENMIRLCLTQPDYDDAFFYLEKMKDVGFKPRVQVYEWLAVHCVERKDGRWKIVLDEMTSMGYRKSQRLRSIIEGSRYVSGRGDRQVEERPARRDSRRGTFGVRQQQGTRERRA